MLAADPRQGVACPWFGRVVGAVIGLKERALPAAISDSYHFAKNFRDCEKKEMMKLTVVCTLISLTLSIRRRTGGRPI
jgi:hypothetical protein